MCDFIWAGYTLCRNPAIRTHIHDGVYRAYVHFKNDRQFDQETMAARCREIAAQFGSAHVGVNSNYFASNSKSIDFVTVFGIAALVLAGGYVVIQSIFRISVNDKIQSYGQLRTIGATPRQIRRVVKKESGRLGGIGILMGVLLGVGGGLLLFPKGFHGGYYGVAVLLTVMVCWFMVSISVHRPVKIAANISPLETMRFSAGQEKVHNRKKHRKLSPISMGFANFGRDRKKSVSIAVSHSWLEDRKRPVASSPEICGSCGNAAARGRRLRMAGNAVCPAGSVGCGNCNFIFICRRHPE